MQLNRIKYTFRKSVVISVCLIINLLNTKCVYGSALNDVPTSPNLLELTEITDHSFKIQWQPPEEVPGGTLLQYKIIITKVKEQYYVPFDCVEYEDPLEIAVFPNVTEYVFQEAKAFTEYKVQVFAEDNVGSSPGSNFQHGITTQIPSEPIRIVIVVVYREWELDAYNVSVIIHWMMPCNSYGELLTYSTEFRGTRGDLEPHVVIEEIPVDPSVLYPQATLALHPAYSYNFSIWANTENYQGEIHIEPFQAPSGVPPPTGNLISPPLAEAVDNPHKEALFEFGSNLFNNILGDVSFYSIILGQLGNEEESTWGYWNQVDWPQVGNWTTDFETIQPYQCTPEKWNPFSDGQNITSIVLGSEQCENGQRNCNGPLRPSTSYTIKVRGYTMGGFRDSITVYFKTGEYTETTTDAWITEVTVDPKDPPDAAIVLIILFVSIGVMFVFAGMVFLYHNFIKHVNFTERNNTLETPVINS